MPAWSAVAVVIAWVVIYHDPRSAVAPALAWSTASIVLISGLRDIIIASADTSRPLPLAAMLAERSTGLWPLNLAGILALLLVFPDGPGRGRVWSAVPWIFAVGTVGMTAAMWGLRQTADGRVVGDSASWQVVLWPLSIALIGAAMVLAIARLAATYRGGSPRAREQTRWLMLSGVVVLVLLVAGWIAGRFGASVEVAFTPFLLAIVTLVPAAVGIAIVRHDLFDVDRLLGSVASWLLTLVLSAAVFGAVVLAASRELQEATTLGPTAAAFVTALVILPMQRFVHTAVSRVVDRDRHVAVARVERFAADVGAGRREPEEVEKVLREAQGDAELRLLLAGPDGGWVNLAGAPANAGRGYTVESGGVAIAHIALDWESVRARRRVADLARAAWVPIEVSRLRLVLRAALAEAQASRARLAETTAIERRRLERDLHDTAQQRLVALGMRLTLLERVLSGPQAAEARIAVEELRAAVDEVRTIAHGVRPSRLDDGLEVALAAVRASTPLPCDLQVADLPALDDTRTLTAYLVVTEAIANVLKHADASQVTVRVTGVGDRAVIEVTDDGAGGVLCVAPLNALRDRVLSVGGTLSVDSPAGHGTTIRAVI